MTHPWLRFALRRALRLVVSLIVLLIATFLTMQLVPGDPARAGLGPTASPRKVEARRAELHLDEPVLSQFERYVRGAVHGDFGRSLVSGQPVGEIIGERLPATARLAGLAFLLSVLLAIPLGIFTAVLTRGGRHRGVAATFSLVTSVGVSVPDYLVATGLVALFGVTLLWLPIAGASGPESYVLPVLALSLMPIATLARVARVEMLSVLDREYMTAARAKRLPRRLLYIRHALPNALTATLTVGGLLLASLIAGTVIVENVFAWPGLGSAVTQAIVEKDYPLVQGIVLVLGGISLVVTLLVDVVIALLDPRSIGRES